MTPKVARLLAGQLGDIVWVPEEPRECRGKFFRVKVSIDIRKPLKRVLNLNLGGAEEQKVVILTYENLPEFCYTCGRLGHEGSDCRDAKAREEGSRQDKKEYGSWLRANQGMWGRKKNERAGPMADRGGKRYEAGLEVDEGVRGVEGMRALDRTPMPNPGAAQSSYRQKSDEDSTSKLIRGEGESLSRKGEVVPQLITTGTQSGEQGEVVIVNPRERALRDKSGDPTQKCREMQIKESLVTPSAGESIEESEVVGPSVSMKSYSLDERPCKLTQRKWKRAARAGGSVEMGSSPFKRMLVVRRCHSVSPKHRPKDKGKAVVRSPLSSGKAIKGEVVVEGGLKRKKLVFEEEKRGASKKAKVSVRGDVEMVVLSAEPETQARREQ